MQQLTDEDLLLSGSNHRDEKERTVPPDMSSVRQARPDYAYFMVDELRYATSANTNSMFSIFLV
jgi:hypothetical protein